MVYYDEELSSTNSALGIWYFVLVEWHKNNPLRTQLESTLNQS